VVFARRRRHHRDRPVLTVRAGPAGRPRRAAVSAAPGGRGGR
jgi:hypothetical protein